MEAGGSCGFAANYVPSAKPSSNGSPLIRDPLCGRLVLTRLAFALPVAFIAYVEGFLNPFWLWNSLPFGLGLGLIDRAQRLQQSTLPAIGFSLGAGSLSLYFHLAWILDLGEVATGSSTSGVIFLFLPLYALVPGGLGFVVGKAIEELLPPR